VLVISGALDMVVPKEMALSLASSAANGQLWTIDGIGHTGFGDKIGAPYFDRMARFWDAAFASVAAQDKLGKSHGGVAQDQPAGE